MTRGAGFSYLEDVAVADIAFRAWAPDLDGVLAQAARATTGVMVEDPGTVRAAEHRELILERPVPEDLLYDLLDELIFLKDTEGLLLLPEGIRTEGKNGGWRLHAVLAGEPIDPARHALNADVKAVTMHRFRLERTAGGWEAEVVLDI